MARTSRLNEQFAGNTAFQAGRERARAYLQLGAELRAMRERAGLTQRELALKTGLDQADVSRLESGKWGRRGISFDVLGKLLPVFGLRIAHQVKPVSPAVDGDQLARAHIITELLHSDA